MRARHWEIRSRWHEGNGDVIEITVPTEEVPLALELRTVEDVFLQVSSVPIPSRTTALKFAEVLLPLPGDRDPVATWQITHGRRPARSFRIVARPELATVRRTVLRDALTTRFSRLHPRWRHEDPAQLEVWVLGGRDRIACGLRLSSAEMRRHHRDATSLPAALRPVAATAAVMEAGAPQGLLVDPCCGSGTVLAEAQVSGWKVHGFDAAPPAVAAARRALANVLIHKGDALHLPLDDHSVRAIVSNPPWGHRHPIPEGWMESWYQEVARLLEPGGCLVVVAPHTLLPRPPATLRRRSQHRIIVGGRPTAITRLVRA